MSHIPPRSNKRYNICVINKDGSLFEKIENVDESQIGYDLHSFYFDCGDLIINKNNEKHKAYHGFNYVVEPIESVEENNGNN